VLFLKVAESVYLVVIVATLRQLRHGADAAVALLPYGEVVYYDSHL